MFRGLNVKYRVADPLKVRPPTKSSDISEENGSDVSRNSSPAPVKKIKSNKIVANT